jgi:hypothetical protein
MTTVGRRWILLDGFRRFRSRGRSRTRRWRIPPIETYAPSPRTPCLSPRAPPSLNRLRDRRNWSPPVLSCAWPVAVESARVEPESKGLRMYQGPVCDDYQAISSLVLGRVDVPRPSAPSAAPPTAIPRPTEQPAGSTARATLAVSVGRLAAARSGWTVIRAELLEAKKHDQLASLYERAAALAPPALGRHRRRRAQHHRDVAQARHSTVDRALGELATITGQSGQPSRVAASMDSSVTGTTTGIRSPQRAGAGAGQRRSRTTRRPRRTATNTHPRRWYP